MNKSDAARIISRRLNLNLGRINALLVAASDAGVLPKASGRGVPQLSSLQLAYVLLACIADKGIGVAGQSVRGFAALSTTSGAVLVDLVSAWMSGDVPVSGVHSLIAQLSPASVTVITTAGRLHYGPERSQDSASRVVVVPGSALRAIISELRGASPHEADAAIAASLTSTTAH
jgi:hypothetical protein